MLCPKYCDYGVGMPMSHFMCFFEEVDLLKVLEVFDFFEFLHPESNRFAIFRLNGWEVAFRSLNWFSHA